jgi:hypothetical protein
VDTCSHKLLSTITNNSIFNYLTKHSKKWDEAMNNEDKYTKSIKIRIDPELLDKVKKEAKRLETDTSTYVRWCVRTGLYLDDLNLFIRAKIKEKYDL